MIVSAKIFGGQGNQMFQIAFALCVGQALGYDVEFFKEDITPGDGKKRKINWSTLYSKCKSLSRLENYIEVPDAKVDSIMSSLQSLKETEKSILFTGHVQKCKYLYPYRSFLREFFFSTFDENKTVQQIVNRYNPEEKIAIHIRNFELSTRAGDTNVNFYNTAPWCFYKSVLKRYPELQNREILMFIDDVALPTVVIKYFGNFTLVRESEDVELYIMSKCKYIIRSNSTFSWWAGFLSNTTEKVYVPTEEWLLENETFNRHNELHNYVWHALE
jgi:hypothetical protein